VCMHVYGTQTPLKKRVPTKGRRTPSSGGVLKCVPRRVSRVIVEFLLKD